MAIAIATPIVEQVPLRLDEGGSLRVGETRVTLDTLVSAYKRGGTLEEISENFDTLELADIHAVISYYLRHTDEVEAYMVEGTTQGEEALRKITALRDSKGVRDRQLSRHAAG